MTGKERRLARQAKQQENNKEFWAHSFSEEISSHKPQHKPQPQGVKVKSKEWTGLAARPIDRLAGVGVPSNHTKPEITDRYNAKMAPYPRFLITK